MDLVLEKLLFRPTIQEKIGRQFCLYYHNFNCDGGVNGYTVSIVLVLDVVLEKLCCHPYHFRKNG